MQINMPHPTYLMSDAAFCISYDEVCSAAGDADMERL